MPLASFAALAATPTPGAPAAAAADIATTGTPSAPVALTGAGEYDRRLATIRAKIKEIEDVILTYEGRIAGLESVALADPAETAHVVLIHRNEMGENFVLESLKYELDDSTIYNRIDPGTELNAKKEFEIFIGRLRTGRHIVAVTMVYRGHGYGVYSYLKGYRFKIKSSYTFDAAVGAKRCLKIVGFERETDSLELKDRPHVRYDDAPECKAMPLTVGRGGAAGAAKLDDKDKK